VFLSKPLLSLVYMWHCLMLPVLMLGWLAFGAPWHLMQWCRRVLRREESVSPAAAGERPIGVTRREFVGAALAAAPAVFTIGATAVAVPQLERFRIRRFTLSLPQLPAALDSLTIAHVTDLHVGRFTRGALLDSIVAATNRLEPDLVLLTGDLINHALTDLPEALATVQQMRGRHGVFMCEGNHDLIENPRTFRERTRGSGVRLLVNEAATLDIQGAAVQLLGLGWGNSLVSAGRRSQHGDAAIAASMGRLLERRDPSAFPILLAHHPHAFDHAADLPLTLAGHTHGGQLMLTEQTGFGPAMFRYWSGVYHREERALVVSNGVGNWFPLRTRAPAEIIHLTLRRAAA